jgi:16S rRNA (cytidine1402-2'-O)-methyltransferase
MLHLVATPIGNLADLSPRALETLKNAEMIACEDTRRTWGLLTAFNIPRPEMISYRQGNEDRIAERILQAVRAGRSVAVCSDGGYPGISDPGYRLIRRAAQEKVPYDVLPGASAVDVALLLSGLSTSSYTFKGFPPRKQGALHRFFEEERALPHTLILFESPYRVSTCLKAALDVFGDREAAVCIELTKAHERVSRGFLTELVKEFEGKTVKGEVVIVLAGNNPKFAREENPEQV